MRRFLWIPVICIYIFGLWCLGMWERVLPRTAFASGMSIARMDGESLHAKLMEVMTKPNVSIHLPNRTVTASLADLNIEIDENVLKKSLFAEGFGDELYRLTRGVGSVGIERNIDIPLSAKQEKIKFLVESTANARIDYDAETGKFAFYPPLHDYVAETADILAQVREQFGRDEIHIDVTVRLAAHEDTTLNDLNARLASASADEIVVRVKDGKYYSDIKLYPSEIRSMLAFSRRGDDTVLDIDRTLFENTVSAKMTDRQKQDFQMQEAYPNTVALLNTRFGFNDAEPVVLGIDDGPTTDGSLTDRYIEVDKSQQKMYFFDSGNLVKQFRVSTGYDYPTPVGEFHIMNKAPKAFSSIYSVWMEYWMAFKYAGDIGAALGIHEIAYDVDEKGQRVYHLGDYIGEPKTGGCIALSPGDAKEVYDLSYVGMLVKVVE